MHKVNRHKVGTDCSILLFKVSSLPSPMTILEIWWHTWLLLDSDTKLVLEKIILQRWAHFSGFYWKFKNPKSNLDLQSNFKIQPQCSSPDTGKQVLVWLHFFLSFTWTRFPSGCNAMSWPASKHRVCAANSSLPMWASEEFNQFSSLPRFFKHSPMTAVW